MPTVCSQTAFNVYSPSTSLAFIQIYISLANTVCTLVLKVYTDEHVPCIIQQQKRGVKCLEILLFQPFFHTLNLKLYFVTPSVTRYQGMWEIILQQNYKHLCSHFRFSDSICVRGMCFPQSRRFPPIPICSSFNFIVQWEFCAGWDGMQHDIRGGNVILLWVWYCSCLPTECAYE